MGLKCLLGHDFGEREVERDRREAGDEVVVVYRTVENCRRCGTRRVVSENKEVRSIRSAARAEAGAVGSAADAGDGAAPRTDAGPTDSPPSSAAPTDGDPSAAPPDAGSLIEAAEAAGSDDAGAETDAVDHGATTTADEDDAVILSDDDGTAPTNGTGRDATDDPSEAAPTNGAATADDTADESGTAGSGSEGSATAGSGAELIDAGGDGGGTWPTPDPDAEDEGYDATPHEDPETGVDFGGGLTPTDGDHAAYVGTADDGDDDGGFVRTEHHEATTDGPTEFRCPNCGATRTARDSSLRAGDVCPDCHKGYVAERAVEE